MNRTFTRTLPVITSVILLIGCNQTGRVSPSQSDSLLDFVIDRPISGFWDNAGFGGEFNDFLFTKQTGSAGPSGPKRCLLTGTGEIWSPTKPHRFTITGTATGRHLSLDLTFDDQVVKATGQLKGDSILDSSCTITFTYQGAKRVCQLDCAGDKTAAKEHFLTSGKP